MRLFPLFLRQTPVGDCTSSEEVPDAWSLSPSDPIFRFSWTISGLEKERKAGREKEDERLSLTDGEGLWKTGQGSTLADDLNRKGKQSLGYFYEPLCSYKLLAVSSRGYTQEVYQV